MVAPIDATKRSQSAIDSKMKRQVKKKQPSHFLFALVLVCVFGILLWGPQRGMIHSTQVSLQQSLSFQENSVFTSAALALVGAESSGSAPASAQLQVPAEVQAQTRAQIPLEELTRSPGRSDSRSQAPYAYPPCTDGLVMVNDTILDPALVWEGGRKIPRIVHISSKSRCNDPIFANNIDYWRLKGYSLYLHDDEAVERLLTMDWPEFPDLKKALKCLPQKGAIMTDVWRVLALWEYGGVYADIDTRPVPEKFNETTLTPDDEAFFVMEQLGGEY